MRGIVENTCKNCGYDRAVFIADPTTKNKISKLSYDHKVDPTLAVVICVNCGYPDNPHKGKSVLEDVAKNLSEVTERLKSDPQKKVGPVVEGDQCECGGFYFETSRNTFRCSRCPAVYIQRRPQGKVITEKTVRKISKMLESVNTVEDFNVIF